MPVPTFLALEGLLHQHETRPTRRGLERHGDNRLMAALAGLVFPAPGEDQMARRLDDPIDAADGDAAARRRAHGRAPMPAGADIERMHRNVVAIRSPPFD